ncbi:MAG TPA: AbrB/MazE/SpoVT family DNA-binding domain-containing protein [Verrucomicrobiae bacterium]|jgi:AbrB family looped-hinge helix DNA binding protein
MKETLVPIDHAGRIVLPKSVRQELAIKAGDTFKVSINGLAVMLTPKNQKSGFIRKGKALVFSSDSGETINNDVVTAVLEQTRDEGFLRFKGLSDRGKKS